MRKIIKIIPLELYDPIIAETILNFIKADCPNYRNLEYETLMQCNCFASTSEVGTITGIVAGRRLSYYDADLGIDLKYYCQRHRMIYAIECLHYFDRNIDKNSKDMYYNLLKEFLADKNDSFIVFRPYCPSGSIAEGHEILVEMGFTVHEYDKEKSRYTYIKPPTTY